MFLSKLINTNDGSLTVIVDGEIYIVDRSHENYPVLLQAFHEDNSEDFLVNINPKTAINRYVAKGGLEVQDDKILYRGEVLHDSLTQTILELKRGGHPIEYMVNFLENVLKNPSFSARKELFDFLKHRNMPITADGCFMAYKAVQSNYYSKTKGTLKLLQGKSDVDGHVYNGIGETIECERGEVDDDRRNECSYGLHVGSHKYSGSGGTFVKPGNKIIIVKVNPADVIAVPLDYDSTKMRVCKYEVVEEYKGKLTQTVYGKVDNEYDDKFVNEIIDEYEDDEYDDEVMEMPHPWNTLMVSDMVRLSDVVDNEFLAVVIEVEDDYVIVKQENGHTLDISYCDAEQELFLISINGSKA